jgi:uncharacterized protein YdhG (YjbR/CyaY superfamily)
MAEQTFTEEEKAAMKERAREQREFKKLSGEEQIARKIAEMTPEEQLVATKLNDLVLSISSELSPKTWYGMPAYYRDGKVICFYQPASKFKVRYSTFGFQEDAKLDDGEFWPTSFALTAWNQEIEAQIRALVTRAIGR